jgi:integrase
MPFWKWLEDFIALASAAADCKSCTRSLSRNTVKNLAPTLRAILYQAQQVDEVIASNAAARFGRFFDARHDAREHVVVLEPEDVARVLKAAAKWYHDHELAARVLSYTGMREGELLGLQWDDIDWSRNLIDLRRTVAFRKGQLIINSPKSGKLRTIDIPVSLAGRLRELRSIRQAEAVVAGSAVSAWMFPSASDPNKPMNDAWFRSRVWRGLLDKAKARSIRVHDARHTYASMMLRRGVPIAYVSRQLGHSSIHVTVDFYGHFIPGADRHHIEALAGVIEEAETVPDATQPQPASASESPDSR